MEINEAMGPNRSPIGDEEIEAAAAWLARRECELGPLEELGPPEMGADIDRVASLRAQVMADHVKKARDDRAKAAAPMTRIFWSAAQMKPCPRTRFHVAVMPGQAHGYRDDDDEPIWTWPEG